MRFRLIPREEKFFADFITLADRIVSGATLLERMLASDPPSWDTALQIKQIESECDALTHNIIQRLNQTFVTPIDREDIHTLAKSLDDVMDCDRRGRRRDAALPHDVAPLRRARAGLADLAVGDAGQGGRRSARDAARTCINWRWK